MKFPFALVFVISMGCSGVQVTKPTPIASPTVTMAQTPATCLKKTGHQLSEKNPGLPPQLQLERWGEEAEAVMQTNPKAEIGYEWLLRSLKWVVLTPDNYSTDIKRKLYRVADRFVDGFGRFPQCEDQVRLITHQQGLMFK